jgi:hypothetical protein
LTQPRSQQRKRRHPERSEGSAFYAPKATLDREEDLTVAFRQGTASAVPKDARLRTALAAEESIRFRNRTLRCKL